MYGIFVIVLFAILGGIIGYMNAKMKQYTEALKYNNKILEEYCKELEEMFDDSED